MQILQVQPFMTQLGYTAFIVLLYIFAAMLLLNVMIVIWTFHSFQVSCAGWAWPGMRRAGRVWRVPSGQG